MRMGNYRTEAATLKMEPAGIYERAGRFMVLIGWRSADQTGKGVEFRPRGCHTDRWYYNVARRAIVAYDMCLRAI